MFDHSPLSEQEALMLGDYVVQEAKKERRPSWLWHFGFEGRGTYYAYRTLRDFGFRVGERGVRRIIGRE